MTTQLDAGELLFVDVDDCIPDPTQPRKIFDPVKLSELAGSIKEKGQEQPGKVFRIPNAKKKPHFQIIFGERRWRACEFNSMPYLVRVVSQPKDETDRLESQILENDSHVDLSFMERSRAFSRLRDARDCSVEELARRVGLSYKTVYDYLGFQRLHQNLQDELDNGSMPFETARALSKKDHETQLRLIDAVRGMTSRRAVDYIDTHTTPEERHPDAISRPKKNVAYRAMERFMLRTREGIGDLLDKTSIKHFRRTFQDRPISDVERFIDGFRRLVASANELIQTLERILEEKRRKRK